MKLSICMMTKNAEKHIRESLESIKILLTSIDSELIIIDTGSEDDTLNIAKEYTKNVFFHKWNDDFSEIRNLLIKYSQGEWLFFIDSDEIIEESRELIDFLNSNESDNYNSATVKIKNYINEKEKDKFIFSTVLRLFKRDKDFYFKGAIHEQPKYKHPIYNLNVVLKHYGYVTNDKKLMEYKFNRNVKLLENELLKKDSDKPYIYYQLANSYQLYNKYNDALKYAEKAYNMAKNMGVLQHRMYILISLMNLYFMNEKYKEAENIALEALKYNNKYIDVHFTLANVYKVLFDYDKAIKSYLNYLECLNLYEQNKLVTINDPSVNHISINYKNIVLTDLCALLYKLKNYKDVLKYYEEINDIKMCSMIFYEFVDSFLMFNSYKDLLLYYENKILITQNNEIIYKFEIVLEKYLEKLNEEKKEEFISEISYSDSLYGWLNRVRRAIKYLDNIDNKELMNKLIQRDINELPNYYGDFIYYIMKFDNNSIFELNQMREDTFLNFLFYCQEKYDGLVDEIFNFIKKVEEIQDLNKIRIVKTIEKFLLLSEQLVQDKIDYVLARYFDDGINYINQIYKEQIIEYELTNEITNQEHVFLIYISKALRYKTQNKKEYVRYLRKALKAYPQMKIAIQVLLDEISNQEKIKEKELKELSEQFKKNIQVLIEKGMINEAKNLLLEYKKIFSDDVEIYSIEAVLYIMEGNLDKAEQILQSGIEIDKENFDLVYNLAYLYKLKGELSTSYNLFKKAYSLTENEEIKKQIDELCK